RLVDCPPLRYFPANSLQEFSDFRGYGLRSASGYALNSTGNRHTELGDGAGNDVIGGREKDFAEALTGKDKASKEARREAGNLVRKQWKCLYVECSAKYNWHVSAAFRELLKAIDHKDFGHKPTSARVQEAFRRNQCSVM
uniref:CASPASE_P10 domain-containing protein n=1 Tax=Macrostomum lignano TaxID=282301 RepID=A0A1I8JLD8_9PLAT